MLLELFPALLPAPVKLVALEYKKLALSYNQIEAGTTSVFV